MQNYTKVFPNYLAKVVLEETKDVMSYLEWKVSQKIKELNKKLAKKDRIDLRKTKIKVKPTIEIYT